MTERDDGGQAFPRSPATVKEWESGDEHEVTYSGWSGMTLRDYFAGHATSVAFSGLTRRVESGGLYGFGWDAVARDAYAIADAMLAERAK